MDKEFSIGQLDALDHVFHGLEPGFPIDIEYEAVLASHEHVLDADPVLIDHPHDFADGVSHENGVQQLDAQAVEREFL